MWGGSLAVILETIIGMRIDRFQRGNNLVAIRSRTPFHG